MKILDIPQSGTIGNMVSYRSRSGQFRRRYVIPRDPRTQVQVSRRVALGRAAALWRSLTEAQRAAWKAAASSQRTRTRLNQSGVLTGYLLFVQINCNLAALDLPPVAVPPEAPVFRRNAVGVLTITNTKGVIALKFRAAGKPAQCTIVLGAQACSAGVSYADHFTILGLLPRTVRGVNDITALYVAKYGVPPVGSRVFIQTIEQVNGWRDLPKQISAIVPAA